MHSSCAVKFCNNMMSVLLLEPPAEAMIIDSNPQQVVWSATYATTLSSLLIGYTDGHSRKSVFLHH